MLLYIATWLQLKADRRALTSLEYGLVGSVLAATVAVGFRLLANNASSKFGAIGGSL
jgi:Flp pilus assembly pilin Flp